MALQDFRAEKTLADRSPVSTANRLLFIYLAIGGAWILLSDYTVNLIFSENEAVYAYINAIKGIGFVVITGLVMFKLLLQRELVRREQTLEELEFIQQLNEFSNDPVYVLDPEDDFRMIHVNEAAVRHYGYPREKLLTLKLRDWDPGYVEKQGREGWEKLKAVHFAVFESTHRLADGNTVPVEVSANYIRYKGKEYVGGYFRNISARKQAEKALQESRERFELALRGAELGTWDWDIASGKVIFNRRWAEMLGYRLEELSPDLKTWEKLVHPDDMPEVMKKLENHLKGYTSFYTAEHRLKTKSGEWLWVLGNGSILERDIDGRPVRAVGIQLDINDRKQAEKLAREQRVMLEGVLNSVPQAVFWKDRESRYLGCNRVFADAAGLKDLNEVVGKTDYDLPWERSEAESYVADDRRVIASQQAVFNIIEPITEADGTKRWIQTSKTPLTGADGKVFGVLGVYEDITQRKLAEEALQRSQKLFSEVYNSSPDALFLVDWNTRLITDCNQRALELFEAASKSEVIGQAGYTWHRVPRAQGVVEASREHVAAGGQWLEEVEYVTLKGKHFWGLLAARKLELPAGETALIRITDITSLKQNEVQLRLQESALNAAANGIVITDRQGRIVWCNPAFTNLTGYAFEEVTGLTPQVLKSGRQDNDFYQVLWQTIGAGRVWRGELVNRRKDGTLYDEEMTITPVQKPDGEITHFIAIKQDITQRKLMEAQYLRAQRMEGIGLLAGGIAHDLNNVLAPILMSIQLLEELHPDDDTRDILHSLQNSAQRGADIVRQVLTFARGIKGERLLLAPKHLIKDMSRVAREAFPRNIHITTDVPDDLWNVSGDPTQLHQVLLNLCINARDAMPDGGSLRIKAHNDTVRNLQSELGIKIADGDYVVLAVKDSGMGIPAEIHEKIFEPFFTTKEQGKGTGLGLSTVTGIVKSHHGYLRVISELGKGAEFLVYLPAVKASEMAASGVEKSVLPEGRGELVLVVDDEPAIIDVARDILVRHGYRVLTAGDGTEALSVVAQNQGKVNLVVTDIMMPFMDGVALVRSLRRLAPEIKVLACSGLASGASMSNKVEELRRLGVSPIMHKPFTAQRLLVNVRRALDNLPLEPEEIDSAGPRN